MVLIDSIELKFEARQNIVDHDLQGVVQHPGAEAGQVTAVGLHLDQQAVQVRVHLVGLETNDTGELWFTQEHNQ